METAAAERVATLEAEERATPRAIREQMESAYGRLRDYYKAAPAQAERFFHRGFGSRRTPPTPTTPTA